jgi:hypothetical protein
VQLKEMRMTWADADPDYFDHSFGREGSNAFDWEEECAEINRRKFFAQANFDILGDIREEAESEMQLIAGGPAHTSNAWVEIDQDSPN